MVNREGEWLSAGEQEDILKERKASWSGPTEPRTLDEYKQQLVKSRIDISRKSDAELAQEFQLYRDRVDNQI